MTRYDRETPYPERPFEKVDGICSRSVRLAREP